MTFYLFHQGSESNRSYSLHLTQPRVTRQLVPSDKTQGMIVPLYETPDSFLFNFCLYGAERRAKVKFPLGSVTKLTVEMEPVEMEPWP